MQAIPFVVWVRPVIRHDRVGEHSAVVWKFVKRRPRSASRWTFGVSISPPNGCMAEKPTSSSTTYRTLGEPGGAFGCSYGAQSGVESRMSRLMVPLNGVLMRSPGEVWQNCLRDHQRRGDSASSEADEVDHRRISDDRRIPVDPDQTAAVESARTPATRLLPPV